MGVATCSLARARASISFSRRASCSISISYLRSQVQRHARPSASGASHGKRHGISVLPKAIPNRARCSFDGGVLPQLRLLLAREQVELLVLCLLLLQLGELELFLQLLLRDQLRGQRAEIANLCNRRHRQFTGISYQGLW